MWAVALWASHSVQAAIYQCKDANGQTVYSDAPCGANAKTIDLPAAPRSSTAAVTPPVPSNDPAGQSRLESFAAQCATHDFNQWVQAQHPLTDPNVRIAKFVELSNLCRRAVHLPDMKPPPPRPTPFQGQAHLPKDADFIAIVTRGSVARLQNYLQTADVKVNDRSDMDKSLLDHAAELNQLEIARYLIEHGAKVDAAQTQGPDRGLAPLHRAAAADAAEVASVLMANGATVNYHGPLGITPLIIAAAHGSLRTTTLLLDHGADIPTATGNGRTALSEATANHHPDIVRVLLLHVPKPTTQSLTTLAVRADVDAIRLLMQHDALAHDIDSVSKDTALRFAILGDTNRLSEREQIIDLLLADGADINNQVNNAPNTPIMMVTLPGLAEFLIVRGADLNAVGWYGTAANQLACNPGVQDRVGMFKVLLAHHADITTVPTKGKSGAQCALEANQPELIAFLRTQGVATGAVSPEIAAVRDSLMTLAGTADLSPGVDLLAALQISVLSGGPGAPARTDPSWQALFDQIRSDLFRDAAPAFQARQAQLRQRWDAVLASQLSAQDIHQLNTFYHSQSGRRYLAFQRQLDVIQAAVITAATKRMLILGDTRPITPAGTAENLRVIERRKQLLGLSWSSTVTTSALAGPMPKDPNSQATLQGFLDLAATTQAAQLDALQAQYSDSLLDFATFQRSAGAAALLSAYGRLIRDAANSPTAAQDPVRIALTRSVALHTGEWRKMLGVGQGPPPVVTVTHGSSFTNVTAPGNLATTRPIACGGLDRLDNSHTPPDLYQGVKDCVEHDRYAEATGLLSLAGMESQFDAARVTDKSAGQAGQVLILMLFNGETQQKQDLLRAAVRALPADPKALAAVCAQVRRIGYPTYYPEYMVMHGINAFTGDPHANALEPHFDAAAAWARLQTTYLNCP
jgi:ankyrin repeat protein